MIIAAPKTSTKLVSESREITQIICSTTIEQRSDLFNEIARQLEVNTQNYTARLMYKVAASS